MGGKKAEGQRIIWEVVDRGSGGKGLLPEKGGIEVAAGGLYYFYCVCRKAEVLLKQVIIRGKAVISR